MVRETAVYIRVTDEEKGALERAARKEELSLSAFLRRALMIERYLVWDATAMRELRRRVEDLVEERERELAEKGHRKRA
jgi:uncharacterized protein (DUF1778 family)